MSEGSGVRPTSRWGRRPMNHVRHNGSGDHDASASSPSPVKERGSEGVRRPRPPRQTRVVRAASAAKVRFAREQRRQPTHQEEALSRALRGSALGVRFRRQHPVDDFVLDFYCDAASLAVEVDGPQHEDQADYDEWRDAWLREKHGIRVIRVRAVEMDRDLARVPRRIRDELNRQLRLTPLPPSP
jgi:very-short-patch-repair endonuclease